MQLAFVECRDQQIASNSGFGKIGFLDKFSEILRIAKFKFVCGWEFCECQPQTKHVERLLFHFSDVGSTPTASTKKTRLGLFLWRGSCCALHKQTSFATHLTWLAPVNACPSAESSSHLTASPTASTKRLAWVFFVAWELLCSAQANSVCNPLDVAGSIL